MFQSADIEEHRDKTYKKTFTQHVFGIRKMARRFENTVWFC